MEPSTEISILIEDTQLGITSRSEVTITCQLDPLSPIEIFPRLDEFLER